MNYARAFTRTAQWTRPADTTQYTAADAVSDVATTTATVSKFLLPNMSKMAGMGGIIHSITLHKTDHDLVGADFDVYFFSAAVAGTGFEDNATIAITDAEWQTCVGYRALTATGDARSVETGDLYTQDSIILPYQGGTDGALYFVVVARGTYTPASEEVFTLTVGGVIY